MVRENDVLDWECQSELLTVRNSWLIIMDYVENSPANFKARFNQFLSTNNFHLRFDSQVYALGFGSDSNDSLILLEAYRIGPNSPREVTRQVSIKMKFYKD